SDRRRLRARQGHPVRVGQRVFAAGDGRRGRQVDIHLENRGTEEGLMTKHVAVLVSTLLAFPGTALAQGKGDVFDQFFRYVELKTRSLEPHLPGETVDHFTGTLRIVQEDLALPGKAGLDLHVIRTYSSKIWGRSDLLVSEPFLADKEPTVVGLGWSLHMGRVR